MWNIAELVLWSETAKSMVLALAPATLLPSSLPRVQGAGGSVDSKHPKYFWPQG